VVRSREVKNKWPRNKLPSLTTSKANSPTQANIYNQQPENTPSPNSTLPWGQENHRSYKLWKHVGPSKPAPINKQVRSVSDNHSNMQPNTQTAEAIPPTTVNNKTQPPKPHHTPNYRDPRYYTKSQLHAPSTSTSSTPTAGIQNKHRHHSLSSSSNDELEEPQPANPNDWQQVGRVKRKRQLNTQHPAPPSHPKTSNRFDILMKEPSTLTLQTTHKPPLLRDLRQYMYTG
jgi:hypothetical protein